MMTGERRSDERVRSKGEVTVRAEGPHEADGFRAEVFDVSRSGISVLMEQLVLPGTRVSVDAGHLAADGVVVHCTAVDGRHHVGIAFDLPPAA